MYWFVIFNDLLKKDISDNSNRGSSLMKNQDNLKSDLEIVRGALNDLEKRLGDPQSAPIDLAKNIETVRKLMSELQSGGNVDSNVIVNQAMSILQSTPYQGLDEENSFIPIASKSANIRISKDYDQKNDTNNLQENSQNGAEKLTQNNKEELRKYLEEVSLRGDYAIYKDLTEHKSSDDIYRIVRNINQLKDDYPELVRKSLENLRKGADADANADGNADNNLVNALKRIDVRANNIETDDNKTEDNPFKGVRMKKVDNERKTPPALPSEVNKEFQQEGGRE